MRGGSETDDALILASCRGEREAFARIIERYQRAVHAVAYSGARDRALADDVTQNTFVTAWRQLGELRDASRLGSWLCGIARNLARDERKRRHREVPEDAADEPTHTTTPFEALSEAETERIVATALGQVPDVYREPLVLYYYEERSVDDVARSLGISAATTTKRLSRGRRYLAECVAIVERGLVRRGPSPGLAASVLAIIAITPASHVDASPVMKGSTMNKLALAAVITASLGGAGLLVANVSRSDAHAKAPATTGNAAAAGQAPQTGVSCNDGVHARHADHAAVAARPAPSLTTLLGNAASTGGARGAIDECQAIGRHLAELEADTTHGPANRPDEATCEQCASHYASMCESEGWSAERRACTLAAADLINAHLCAGGAVTTASADKPVNVPAALSCAVLSTGIASTVQGAGMHADVKDMPQQIEAACEMGGWSIELRQCFAAADSIMALQACMSPTGH